MHTQLVRWCSQEWWLMWCGSLTEEIRDKHTLSYYTPCIHSWCDGVVSSDGSCSADHWQKSVEQYLIILDSIGTCRFNTHPYKRCVLECPYTRCVFVHARWLKILMRLCLRDKIKFYWEIQVQHTCRRCLLLYTICVYRYAHVHVIILASMGLHTHIYIYIYIYIHTYIHT